MPDLFRFLSKCVFTLALLLSALGLVSCSSSDTPGEELSDIDTTGVADISNQLDSYLPVTITVVGDATVTLTAQFSAVTKGLHEAKLSLTRVSSIEDISVSLGDRVMSGDTIALLDSDVEEAAVKSATADLLSARANSQLAELDKQRAQKKFAQGMISEAQRDRADASASDAAARVGAAEAALALARHNLRLMIVTAPISGEVSQLPFEVGETPPQGATIAEIVDRSSLLVDIFLSDGNLSDIVVGSEVIVNSAALPGASCRGTIRSISPKGDERTCLFRAEALIENPGLTLRAGMAVDVQVTLIDSAHGLYLPRDLVLSLQSAPKVVLLKDNVAVYRNVSIGKIVNNYVLITAGLVQGDTLVVGGMETLEEGSGASITGEIIFDSLFD